MALSWGFLFHRGLIDPLHSHLGSGGSGIGGHYTGRRGRLWAGLNGAPKSSAELARLRSSLLKRTRGPREPCVVPDKLVYRVDVGGNDGAMVVAFSHSGHVLASK